MKATTMQEVMKENNVTPVTNVNGTPVVSFEEQRDMAQDMINNSIDIGIREYNQDGTLARTLYKNAAINIEQFFNNRYRVVGDDEDKEMQMVIAHTTDGYRAISEQSTGRVFQKQVPIYVFKRDGKKLKFVRLDVVSDVEFIAEFTHKLSAEAMQEILPLIPVDANVAEETLPI